MAGCRSHGGSPAGDSGSGPTTAAANGDVTPASPLVGRTWIAEDIGGRGVIDNLQSSLTFESADKVNGLGGCNRFAGPVKIEGETIKFGSLAATRMACAPAISDQESKFFGALDAARRFSVDPRGLLHLDDEDGAPLMRLSRRNQTRALDPAQVRSLASRSGSPGGPGKSAACLPIHSMAASSTVSCRPSARATPLR